MYLPKCSRTFLGPFTLVVVGRIVLNRSKEGNQSHLLAATDILIKCGIYRVLLCLVPAKLLSLLDQTVVNGKIGWHGLPSTIFYTITCVRESRLSAKHYEP